MLYCGSVARNLLCLSRSQTVRVSHQVRVLHAAVVNNRKLKYFQGDCLLVFSNKAGLNANLRLNSLFWRCLSTEGAADAPKEEKVSKEKKEDETLQDSVKTLYRFPHIKQMRTIMNLKIYQTALCALVVPYVYSFYLKGMVTVADFASSVVLMTVATTMLYILSLGTKRFICVLKYNEETKDVHISHLTFWGRRRDVMLNLEKIVPLSDTDEGEKINDAYLKLETYDTTEIFYLFHKFCTQEQAEDIMRIFK